ncbi:MAG TPA: S-4TM family putative pore-forming effector, partial [Solirubrobacterales bacterium]
MRQKGRHFSGPAGNGPVAEPPLAERLIAAYSQRYREASRWKTATWVGAGLLFLTSLVTVAVGHGVTVLGLVGSAYLLCSRLILRPEMTKAHRDGVLLQEQYDTSVFGLPWNRGLAGGPLSIMDVEDLAGRFRGNPEDLVTWYVDTGEAPVGARVLLRQLENATWGRWDHRRFAVAVLILLLVSIA